MSKIIIGIHGLGNKAPKQILQMWWQKAIEEGLQPRFEELPELPFELVYWADLIYERPLNPAITDKKHEFFIDDPYVSSPKAYTAEKPSNLRRKILDMVGDQIESVFLNENLTINYTSVSDFIINRFFKELGIYYNTYHPEHGTTDLMLRQKIQARLNDVLMTHKRKEILLIAHSMGSIIAFDVLTQVPPNLKIDTLVTIGSPLGIPTIRSKIATEHSGDSDPRSFLKTPECIQNQWINLTDLRDKMAVYYRLADDFSPNSNGVGVVDKTVINDYVIGKEKNPHKSYGYLRTPEMSDILTEFLQRKSPGMIARLWEMIGFGKHRKQKTHPAHQGL